VGTLMGTLRRDVRSVPIRRPAGRGGLLRALQLLWTTRPSTMLCWRPTATRTPSAGRALMPDAGYGAAGSAEPIHGRSPWSVRGYRGHLDESWERITECPRLRRDRRWDTPGFRDAAAGARADTKIAVLQFGLSGSELSRSHDVLIAFAGSSFARALDGPDVRPASSWPTRSAIVDSACSESQEAQRHISHKE
jgi:hypothetical protein